MLLKLAWRNIWRNRTRTLITMASVAFAVLLCTVMRSLQEGIYLRMIQNVVGFYSGYVQIHKKGYWEERTLDNAFAFSDSLQHQLQSLTLAPRLESFALAASEKQTNAALVAGIGPEAEQHITSLKNKLSRGQYLRPQDQGVLLAEGLAAKLHLGLGDTLLLFGQGYHGSSAVGKYPVQGLLRFGSPELNNQMVYMALAQAQQLYSAPGLVTSLLPAPDDSRQLGQFSDRLAQQLGSAYEVMTWDKMMPELAQSIAVDRSGNVITLAVLYMIMSFGIFGTVIMMLAERRFEFGVLIAIGMRKGKIALMLMAETLILALLGTLLGMALALPVVYYLTTHPIHISGKMAEMYERFGMEPVLPATLELAFFGEQALIVFVLTLLIGIYPFVKIFQQQPVAAMKK